MSDNSTPLHSIMTAPAVAWHDAEIAPPVHPIHSRPDVRPIGRPPTANPPTADAEFNDVRAARLAVDDSYRFKKTSKISLPPACEVDEDGDGGAVVLRRGGGDRVRASAGAEAGHVQLLDSKGRQTTYLGTDSGRTGIWLGGTGGSPPGAVVLRGGHEEGRVVVDGADGSIALRPSAGPVRVHLGPSETGGHVSLFGKDGTAFGFIADADGFAHLHLGGKNSLPGRIMLTDGEWKPRITLDAQKGDIILANADCAEEFEVVDAALAEPGTVLVLDDEPGSLRTSRVAYDTRVAGVVSGAGAYKPGIVLDRSGVSERRRAIALVGKVFCKVEADSAPIKPGTLLTTSDFPGHAMAASDRERSFGAVIGKALKAVPTGTGLIPILVALQ